MKPLSILCLTAAAVLVGPCASQVDPAYARNLTAYHVNPADVGAVPINMDTGDAIGDIYFYLQQFLLPLECANGNQEGRARLDCNNLERTDPNLVVTKVDLEIDSRTTTYSACNLCNGTDPITKLPCQNGTYRCDCFNLFSKSYGKCDPERVGVEDIKETFAPHRLEPKCAGAMKRKCGIARFLGSKLCFACLLWNRKELREASCGLYDALLFCPNKYPHCNATSPEWMCWSENIPRKYNGTWYSTMKEGRCHETSAVGSCGWKVFYTRTIRNDCLSERLMTHVESKDPRCFGHCGPRNTTSSCWIGCFFDKLLGPQARHSSTVLLSGLPVSELKAVWEDSFLPEEQGGCPSIDIPSSWEAKFAQEPFVV